MLHTIKLASVLSPLSDANLRLAAQSGVEEIVARYSGPDLSSLTTTQARIEAFGMRLGVIEGGLPIDAIKLGVDDGTELNQMKALVRHLGTIGVPIVCYNFMAGTDWIRTSIDTPERGGSKVTAFDLGRLGDARIPGRDPYIGALERGAQRDDLWTNLEAFLNEIIPIAEEAGVALAMHPDDPPLPHLLGNDRIMWDVEGFERLVSLVPSPANAIALCQGTFSEMGIDIPATIRRLGRHIAYVHFRDVRGTAESFTETWQDNGQTDMVAAVHAYREVGFAGPMRPDHVPQMHEEEGVPGYTMLGRLFAYGYIRGLIQATAPQERVSIR
jgi:mannonate dehydratase